MDDDSLDFSEWTHSNIGSLHRYDRTHGGGDREVVPSIDTSWKWFSHTVNVTSNFTSRSRNNTSFVEWQQFVLFIFITTEKLKTILLLIHKDVSFTVINPAVILRI